MVCACRRRSGNERRRQGMDTTETVGISISSVVLVFLCSRSTDDVRNCSECWQE